MVAVACVEVINVGSYLVHKYVIIELTCLAQIRDHDILIGFGFLAK